MNKNFNTLEVLNIVSYFNNVLKPEQIKVLPTKLRWYLKKNLELLIPIAKNFDDFKNSLIKEKIQDVFLTDEKSVEIQQEVTKEDGTKETRKNRKIKDEYIEEYNEAIKEFNDKIAEILKDDAGTFDISVIDLDAFVDSLDYNSEIDFDCINMLSFMDNKTDVTKEAE